MGSQFFVRSLLALGLVLSLFGGTVRFASANEGSHPVYFPWLPNGAMLGTMGPFTGSVTVQNLEGETIAITYHPNVPGAVLKTRDLAAFGSITLSADDIDVPSPGSAVSVVGTKKGIGNLPARIAAVQKQSTPVGPHIPSPESRTSAAHHVVEGYTGLTSHYWSRLIVLPIVQTNSGWNTIIRIRSSETATGPGNIVTVTLRPAGSSNSQSFTEFVSLGETITFDLLARGVPEGFVGSAIISTTVHSTAIAERYKPSTNMLIINVAQSITACQTTHYAPLIFDNYHSWNTGISVANLGNTTNNVKVTYYATDGAPGDSIMLDPIPPNGMGFAYKPATGDGASFLGAAVIEGTAPLCAVVDEVKYTGTGGDVGHAMSYATTETTIDPTLPAALVLPLVQKGSPATGLGDTSGIQLFNPTGASVAVDVVIRNQAGVVALQQDFTIEAWASHTVYAMGIDLPVDFQGTATISTWTGQGKVVGIANNVNYAVQFDGSASYSLVLRP